jgi:FlaA1/EpsC-like NDP-sugar epimerase
MITLSGFRPDEDIRIVYTGVRPGEKLFEELKTEGEDIEPTVHPKIMIWAHSPVPWQEVSVVMDDLEDLRNCPERETIIATMKR